MAGTVDRAEVAGRIVKAAKSRPEPESTLPLVKLAYAGSAMNPVGVRVVGEWDRGKLTMVMSASSGPKDYIKNLLCAQFDADPGIERIRMVINEHNVPFCIFGVQGKWFDASAREVRFSGQ